MPSKATMATTKTQYPKSEAANYSEGEKPRSESEWKQPVVPKILKPNESKNQYPAYALKSDDGTNKPNILKPMLLTTATMAKNWNTETRINLLAAGPARNSKVLYLKNQKCEGYKIEGFHNV